MTREQFYTQLKARFQGLLYANKIENDLLSVSCRALTPEEAIGSTTVRQDFPILTGKDIMLQAEYKGAKGQAFTSAPAVYNGTLKDILNLDILHNAHERSIFVACINAVMAFLGQCTGTVHCRKYGPEACAQDMQNYLECHYPNIRRIALIGYQPALLEMLSTSIYEVRVLDLNPDNIGQIRYGIYVEDGELAKDEIKNHYAQLILCTGSTICNGSIVDYLDLKQDVLFFGTSAAGAAALLGLKRVCFAEKYIDTIQNL